MFNCSLSTSLSPLAQVLAERFDGLDLGVCEPPEVLDSDLLFTLLRFRFEFASFYVFAYQPDKCIYIAHISMIMRLGDDGALYASDFEAEELSELLKNTGFLSAEEDTSCALQFYRDFSETDVAPRDIENRAA